MIIEIQTVDPSTGFEICIFPQESRRKRAAWIMWVSPDGSGQLYTKREPEGAVIGPYIALPKSLNRSERKPKKKSSIKSIDNPLPPD